MAKSADILTLAADPVAFRRALRIDVDGSSKSLADCMDPWQADDFRAMDPAWRRLVGQSVDVEHSRGWLERARGHSKTSDLAVMVTWSLLISRRPLRGVVAAGDVDQASLLRDAIERLVTLNPWLASFVSVKAAKLVNPQTGSECSIITSDAPSSYGLLPDFVVADEIVHWRRRDLWDSLLSAVAKRKHCLFLVITNAGFAESWQWDTREAIRTDPSWYFSRLDGPQASWITADRLAEQERLLPTIAYERLWLNRWSSGAGDALCSDDIVAATDPELMEQPGRDEVCVGGLDLGLKHDASAFVIVAKGRASQLRVIKVRRWQAPKGGKLDLAIVEQGIADDAKLYRLHRVSADPWQASYLIDRLRKAGVPIFERHQNGSKLVEQCMSLVEAFTSGAITIPQHKELLAELQRARIEERSYGVRLIADRDRTGHGDIVSALSIALAEAKSVVHAVHHLEGWDPPTDVLASLRGEPSSRSAPASRMSFGHGRFGIKL